jgi:hypothetical protein
MPLEEAYEAAERLKHAHDAGELKIEDSKMAETARRDLDRFFEKLIFHRSTRAADIAASRFDDNEGRSSSEPGPQLSRAGRGRSG